MELTNGNKDILCAIVNGKLRELDYDVYYDSTIEFLTIKDHDANEIYERGIRFIFAMATHLLYPQYRFNMSYSISRSISVIAYVKNEDNTMKRIFLTKNMVKQIEDKMREIVDNDYPLIRLIKPNDEARKIYQQFALDDKLEILQYRPGENLTAKH